jgi:hypothetical protein
LFSGSLLHPESIARTDAAAIKNEMPLFIVNSRLLGL